MQVYPAGQSRLSLHPGTQYPSTQTYPEGQSVESPHFGGNSGSLGGGGNVVDKSVGQYPEPGFVT